MTEQSPPRLSASPTGRSAPRARTLAFQGAANLVIRGLLRTPLVCRAAGRWLITIYVVGRKSGRRYAVPVAYTCHDGHLLVGTPFPWGRNLRSGEPVEIRYKGRRIPVDVEAVTDQAGVVENWAIMARANHQFARFNNIAFDQAGSPNPGDLRRAWAAGARAFRLTAREPLRCRTAAARAGTLVDDASSAAGARCVRRSGASPGPSCSRADG